MVARAKKSPPAKTRVKKSAAPKPARPWYLRKEEFAAIPADCPSREFAQGLLDNPQAHCRWVHLAVRRHAQDLRTVSAANSCGPLVGGPSPKGGEAAKSPFIYDPRKAARPIRYASRFKIYSGDGMGNPMRMLPWQRFVVSQLYGWRLASDPRKRRFNYAYIAVPRKNGKTGLVSPLGLFHMSHPPRGGQVKLFSVATKLDQAKISWEDAISLLRTSTLMSAGQFADRVNRLIHPPSGSEWRPLGSDKSTLDGLRPDLVIMDELHAWEKRGLWDVINTAFSAAFSPLVLQITTAGDDREGICGEQEKRVLKVLETVESGTYDYSQSRDASHYFGSIWTLDKGDKWQDEATWFKANPSLGTVKSLEDMRTQAEAALGSLGARREFLIKHLNQWQATGAKRWLDPLRWDACAGTRKPEGDGEAARPPALGDEGKASPSHNKTAEGLWERLRGREVYCGLDLASTIDTSAFCAVAVDEQASEREKALHTAAWSFWLPSEGLSRRVRLDNCPYDTWAREGYLTLTPGEVSDITQIERDIVDIIARYELNVVCFCIDSGHNRGTPQRLADDHGLPVATMVNNYTNMTAPLNELERLVISGRLDHGNNPMAREHALNATLREGGAGGRLLDKGKSSVARIDGLAALSMALAARLHAEAEGLTSQQILFAST